jgi:hypothetical protein
MELKGVWPMYMRRAWSRTGAEVRRSGGLGRNLAAIGACIGILAGTTSVSVVSANSAYAAVVVNVPCTGVGGGTAGLIAAVNTANSQGGGTINLASGCTYNLTTPFPGDGTNGLPVITSSITVNGNNSTLAANHTFRVLQVGAFNTTPENVTLNGLTVTGGNAGSAPGGGILVESGWPLTLKASQVTQNTTSAPGQFVEGGGGIFNIGRLTLIASQVSDNTSNNSVAAFGGGILNSLGTLTMTASSVTGNHVSSSGGGFPGGGGGIFNFGPATLNFSLVADNTVSFPNGNATGGGILTGLSGQGTITMNSSLVADNTASSPNGNATGGGITNGGPANLNFSLVVGNRAIGSTAAGGGIFNQSGGAQGVATLFFSLVTGNLPNNCRPLGSVPGCID